MIYTVIFTSRIIVPSDFSIIIIIIIEYLADLHSTETIRLYRKVPETCATGHQRIKRRRRGWLEDGSVNPRFCYSSWFKGCFYIRKSFPGVNMVIYPKGTRDIFAINLREQGISQLLRQLGHRISGNNGFRGRPSDHHCIVS